MALKPRYKRRIIWTIVSLMGIAAMCVIVIPPMITLNSLKPKIQQAIAQQTGVSADIRGDVHFSLLGRTTIVAHDIVIPIGTVGAAMFSVPLTSIFNLSAAQLTGNVSVYGANVKLDSLAPYNFNHTINIHNSTIQFQDRQYDIIRARLDHGNLVGTLRTNQHKYDVDISGDEFQITNQSNNLRIIGNLYSDGTARGHMTMQTDNINKFFDFTTPTIRGTVDLATDFEWNGGTGFNFTDIQANNVSGNIRLGENGDTDIKLSSPDLTYDFSFLLNPQTLLHNTNVNLDFYGHLTFADHEFSHLKIVAIGTPEKLQIENIIADDIAIVGGTIDTNGAHNLMITAPYDGTPAMCIFSGTPTNWGCSEFTYGNMWGRLAVNGDKYEIFINSDQPLPSMDDLATRTRRFGKTGTIHFQFSDAAGTVDIQPNTTGAPKYTFARNKTLSWLAPNLEFIPPHMRDAIGDFALDNTNMKFIPHTGNWAMEINNSQFFITGRNFHDLVPNTDLRSLNNAPYTISGAYHNGVVSNLNITVAGHEFTGTINNGHITLKTNTLNLDSFINPEFIDRYPELEFLTTMPIVIPFTLNATVSLSADTLIYNGNAYKNFVYSLKPNIQTFSITDAARGNILATLRRNGTRYDIFAQLNKFLISDRLLSSDMPVNIRDTMITAEINMTTFGHIAHDLVYNLSGTMDISFSGGYLTGIGIDEFFASATDITTLNAEYALAAAFDGGKTAIKSMRIVGAYADGTFTTTRPFELRMRHTDATGTIQIANGQMTANIQMIMRGTSPAPAPIELTITPNGKRNYSLSEIMINFDPEYMREFVKTHTQF